MEAVEDHRPARRCHGILRGTVSFAKAMAPEKAPPTLLRSGRSVGVAEELFGGDEVRLDINRYVFQFVQHSLYFGTNYTQTSLHVFGFVVIAFGLDCHEI